MARLGRRLPWRAGRAGLAVALAGLALGAGWLWLRDSSLLRVERVSVSGSSSSEAPRVRAALEQAALGMSTLHVDTDALRDVVRPYRSVAGLEVRRDLPHDLTVIVREHTPVATVQSPSGRTPSTGGGRLLTGVRASDLPLIPSRRPAAGGRVTDPLTLDALSVAAAAPAELRRRAQRVWFGARGITLGLRDGPPLVFGSAVAAQTKWKAAARVLAEPAAAGATYLDLRIPGTVAAGGVGALEPEPTPVPDPLQANPQP